MKIKILIDNIANDDLTAEWGLAVWIEYKGCQFLLDTGNSGVFADNAEALGIKLDQVDYGILSHAHYDHADGMDRFFEKNQKAAFYLRAGAKENCYGWKDEKYHYNGIRQGILKKYEDRIVYTEGNYQLVPGVYLIPHKTAGLEHIGKKARLFVEQDGQIVPDSFAHEQSLVFETEKGLVIFNSCCHAGADVVLRETAELFPGRQILALIGGFHLFRSPQEEVRLLAAGIRETGIKQIITGHCTGQEAFDILKEELGEIAVQMYTGLEMEL